MGCVIGLVFVFLDHKSAVLFYLDNGILDTSLVLGRWKYMTNAFCVLHERTLFEIIYIIHVVGIYTRGTKGGHLIITIKKIYSCIVYF